MTDATELPRTTRCAGAPLNTKRTRANRGSSASGARAIRFAEKCTKSSGNLVLCHEGVNGGSVDIPAHTATVETTYPDQPRFFAQVQASVDDTKTDDATRPTQNRIVLTVAPSLRLIVVTVDESGSDTGAGANADQATSLSPTGPNLRNPGWSPLLGLFIPGYPKTDPPAYTSPAAVRSAQSCSTSG